MPPETSGHMVACWARIRGRLRDEVGEVEYRTWLPWLIWNEYHNANVDPDPGLFGRLLKPGPYNFQVKGYEAFKQFSQAVDLPAVSRYVKSVRVKV